jgi:glyoxylase-like metal-dependent hydrolase (beta-lactamase superfamily II)
MDEVRVGPYSVVSVVDGSGVLAVTGPEAFPAASEADWASARRLDPAAFGPDLRWALDFRCVAIRRPDGRVTLVDVGIGGEGSPAGWAPLPGRLVAALDEVGIGVDDVDTVVLTHLHEDHCGGVVDGSGSPVFTEARHVVQAVEIASLRAEPDQTIWSYAVEPLLGAGLLDEVDGRVSLTSGVTVVPTPGHTVGHQSVVVTSGDDEVVVTGDVLVHAVQLANPDVAYRSEADQAVAADTRRALLADARRRGCRLATAHLHTPFVTVGSHPRRAAERQKVV